MPRLSDFDSHTPDSRPSHPDTAAAPSAQTLVPSTAPPKENRKRTCGDERHGARPSRLHRPNETPHKPFAASDQTGTL